MADMFEQIISGEDISEVSGLLSSLTVAEASVQLPNTPYSIVTLLYHADYWQKIWLNRIEGSPKPKVLKDWLIPAATEFDNISESFLNNLHRAHKIAKSWPIEHKMKSESIALHVLISLAIHDAYHIGQIQLLVSIIESRRLDPTS